MEMETGMEMGAEMGAEMGMDDTFFRVLHSFHAPFDFVFKVIYQILLLLFHIGEIPFDKRIKSFLNPSNLSKTHLILLDYL